MCVYCVHTVHIRSCMCMGVHNYVRICTIMYVHTYIKCMCMCWAELGELLYESNILHINSYFHLKSNLKVTYSFFKK